MNLNKAFILGNLTRAPETRTLPSGQSVAVFGVATNRFYTDSSGEKKQDAEFHNVVAFGRLADICSRYLNKGSMVLVEGRLKTRSWQNSSGIKQFRTEIIATNIQLAPKTMGSQIPTAQQEGLKQEEIPIIEEETPPSNKDNNKKENIDGGEEEIDVKDIPF